VREIQQEVFHGIQLSSMRRLRGCGVAQPARIHRRQSRRTIADARGVDTQSCAKLAADIRPSEGLNHLPNARLYYWVQGYLSAANIYLINEYSDHLDLIQVDEAKILKLVAQFCRANPNEKPISAIDKFIREAKKVSVKESDAFDPWELS